MIFLESDIQYANELKILSLPCIHEKFNHTLAYRTEGCNIVSFKPEDIAAKIRMALQFGRRTDEREKKKHSEINIAEKRIIKVIKE